MLKVLAAGCSHTDKNFRSVWYPDLDTSWKKWPEVFSDKLGAECTNVGRSGYGNNRIFKSCMLELAKNKYDIVVILWSDSTRIDIYDSYTFFPCTNPNSRPPNNSSAKNNLMDEWIREGVDHKYYDLVAGIKMTIDNMFIIQEYCKAQGIKLIQMMYSGDFAPQDKTTKYHMSLMTMEYDLRKQLDKSCWGYPFNKINAKSIVYDELGADYSISVLDKHFSEQGHWILGNYFYETYNKLY
jgi:hypothetical protein